MFDRIDEWQQRVAFNEGYRKQQIASARVAGADAYSLGLDRVQGRDMFFEAEFNHCEDANDFFNGHTSNGITHDAISDVAPDIMDDSTADTFDVDLHLAADGSIEEEQDW